MICEYSEKQCKYWDEGCDAIHPEQCPDNSKEDVKAIKKWQSEVVK